MFFTFVYTPGWNKSMDKFSLAEFIHIGMLIKYFSYILVLNIRVFIILVP